jgi:cobalt-zinc-cadmium efflux system outer membrane protein
MPVRIVATAVWAAALALAASTATAESLTLDGAIARTIETHPEFRLWAARGAVLEAERERALRRPPLAVGASLENALGTGAFEALDGAELTLSLAGVLERGGKLDARRLLAESVIDARAIERESLRYDLLADVARRYLAVVAARRRSEIATLDIEQRRRTVAAARRRLEAGASPESVVLTAESALARAELDLARAHQLDVSARRHLAALWGERNPAFEVAAASLTALPAIDEPAAMVALVERMPELARFADERRIREARLQLARTSATPDLDWQVGVRRLEAEDDAALIGGVSMPLGTAQRARADLSLAEAELAALEIEREAAGLSLYSTLAGAHGRYSVARLEVQRLADDVLPRLSRAESAAARAFRAGAASYLEWSQLQSERTGALRQQLDAALEAQHALIELQRLTGQPFIERPSASDQGSYP